MLRRSSRAFRIWVVAAALGQALLPGGVGIIDAYAFDDPASAIRSHIEEHSSPHCPRVHQEDNCALCQFVSGALARAPQPPAAEHPQAKLLPTAARSTTWHDLVDYAGLSLPRAPPPVA